MDDTLLELISKFPSYYDDIVDIYLTLQQLIHNKIVFQYYMYRYSYKELGKRLNLRRDEMSEYINNIINNVVNELMKDE